jgi:xanthine dehydrogenase YagS FAD-binding subunit
MSPFSYAIARSEDRAFSAWAGHPHAVYVAGATDVMQLLQDDVIAPATLIDISRLPLTGIEAGPGGVRIGAMARLSDVADDAAIGRHLPLLAQALRETASPQVRNLARMGGNLLQKTRCLYFRDKTSPCNKRIPGSGCPAIDGANRMNAILGGSDQCIAAYAGDMAIALVVLGARVQIRNPDGERSILLEDLHRMPGSDPSADTTLKPDELITEIVIPANPFATHTAYIKVRDRASFAWPVVSAAVGLELDGTIIRAAHVAAGGVGTKPWRLRPVEKALVGRTLDQHSVSVAARAAVEGAVAGGGTSFKLKLLPRVVERAILTAGGQP